MPSMIVTAIVRHPRTTPSGDGSGMRGPKAVPQAITSQNSPPPSGDKLGFWDALDVVNPLQHIPVVSFVYRKLTGDTIKPPAQIAGGFLYGGPLGMGLAAGDVALEKMTGADAAHHVMALLEPKTKPVLVADNMPTPVTESAPSAPPPADRLARGNDAYQQALNRMAVAFDKYEASQSVQIVPK